jgi:hypothetical protein
MSIRNQTKGVKMKSKVALAVVAVLGIFFVQPAEANPGKSLVIIDAYFDSKVYAPNVKCITTDNQACTDVITRPELLDPINRKTPSLLGLSKINTTDDVAEAFRHGNQMAEVAKKQGSLNSIILLKASAGASQSINPRNNQANVSIHNTNATSLIAALTWVDNNSNNVGAVSTSIYINNDPVCSKNVKPGEHNTITSLIAKLKSKNIPVFAATGNLPKSKGVRYPACITDTVSVTSIGNVSDAFTDLNVNLNTDGGVWNFNSPVFGSIQQTTSSVTAAVAAQYILKGMPTTKVVTVNP